MAFSTRIAPRFARILGDTRVLTLSSVGVAIPGRSITGAGVTSLPRGFASGAGSDRPDVYDPRADENYEPPAREVIRGPRFADFRSDTGEVSFSH
jgi:hypothetical protein